MFNVRKWVLLFLMTVLGLHAAKSQLPALYNQYPFQQMALNPGYAGATGVLHAVGLARRQWLRYPGAPLNFSFTLDGPLRDEKNSFGVVLNHERTGAVQRQTLMGVYAYRLGLGKGRLSFGLQGGAELWQSGIRNVYTVDPGDVKFDPDGRQFLIPRFGFGVWYENDWMYVGLSAPQILWLNTGALQSDQLDVVRRRFYFAQAGFRVNLAENWALKPNTMFRYEQGFRPQVDVGLLVVYREKYWLGPMWRSNGDLAVLAAFQLNDQLRLGYAYDFQTSVLRTLSSGSHSLSLTYDFGYRISTTRPRYF
ncbi:MAG: PorP/SprF family type IX secretion system membrane protein [Bacteroidota bacterium]